MMKRSHEAAARPRGTDAAAGRSASVEALARQLASAPAPFIDGALERPDLTAALVLRILLNRRATERQLERIANDGRFSGLREVRRRLFRHPNTPSGVSRRLAAQMDWKGLADAAASGAIAPTLRKLAEGLLRTRLQGMALGERVSLARRAVRGLIPPLAESHEDRVLRALLQNRLLIEADVRRLAEDPLAPREFLRHLADHPEWGIRRSIRYALAANPRTPTPAALRPLRALESDDLRRLAKDDSVPAIVRVGASRLLSERERFGSIGSAGRGTDDPSAAAR